MAAVSPMDAAKRQAGYLAQTGRRRLTPRQKRRATKKGRTKVLGRTLPACGLTHEEHKATWRSWRDDCRDCGYTQQDPEQCALGHPDDGVTWCGACGYTNPPVEGRSTR